MGATDSVQHLSTRGGGGGLGSARVFWHGIGVIVTATAQTALCIGGVPVPRTMTSPASGYRTVGLSGGGKDSVAGESTINQLNSESALSPRKPGNHKAERRIHHRNKRQKKYRQISSHFTPIPALPAVLVPASATTTNTPIYPSWRSERIQNGISRATRSGQTARRTPG